MGAGGEGGQLLTGNIKIATAMRALEVQGLQKSAVADSTDRRLTASLISTVTIPALRSG